MVVKIAIWVLTGGFSRNVLYITFRVFTAAKQFLVQILLAKRSTEQYFSSYDKLPLLYQCIIPNRTYKVEYLGSF